MNIITQGDLNRAKKVKRFECRECGCIFECDATEYRHESHRNEDYYCAKCPTCKRDVWTDK